MRKIILFMLIILSLTSLSNATDFISTWDTTITGVVVTNTTGIQLPLESSGTYSFYIDWGDTNIDYISTWNQENRTHYYDTGGIYEISINGTISGFRFGLQGDRNKIINITQWGDLNVGNGGSYFYGCTDLDINANDVLNLSGTTTLYHMFSQTSIVNGNNISNWDISNITDLSYMFDYVTSFNQSLNSWDTSKVTTTNNMFYRNFNENISSWNTSNLINMNDMFGKEFNGDISSWDVSSVTNMGYLFSNNIYFNQNIGSWNVSSLTYAYSMFNGATSFKQDISSWDVSNLDNGALMFSNMIIPTNIYNNMIINWSALDLTYTSFYAPLSKYSHNITTERELLATKWIVYDGGVADNILPTSPTSFTNLGTQLINYTPSISWTKGTDVDEDSVITYIYVGITNTPTELEGYTFNEIYNLGINITFQEGNTYYYRLRSYDGYNFSNYTIADEFKFNNKPSISNVTISPDPVAVEDDLTANHNTATDADGDSITLYYKWYKDTILHLTTTSNTLNSTNTSNGEKWKVGIIPNDGYENGTEVQSQIVEIGSANSAPTLTGVNIDKNYPIKRYVNFTITTENATDVNGNARKLEVGSATGLSDLGIGEYFTNGNESNITIAMPYYDGLEHTLYLRLNDSNLTSQEYQLTIESDITKPVLNTESISATTGTQGATFGITINTTSVNSTISTVTMHVSRPDATAANWTLTNTVNDTWYYSYTPTSDIGTYTVDYFTITDASDNIKTATSALSFTITAASTGDGGGGGGGGGGTTIINATLGDLTLTPSRLDTYALYAGFGAERVLEYRFIANRAVNGCIIKPNNNTRCEITDGYIIDVFMTVNGSAESYVGKLTVTDNDDYVATADLIVRIVDLGASIDIVEIPIGEASAQTLNPFFASEDGILTGVRLWFAMFIVSLFVFYLFRSDLLQM